jgi:hypothetical protein
MPNSDLVLCYVYESKGLVPTCIDGYAKGYSFRSDESLGGMNDLTKVIGSIHNGRTVIKFSKKLDSGDYYDKAIAKGAELKVLFSYRENGNPSTEHGEFREHSIKTVKSVVLWPSGEETPEVVPAYKTDPDVFVMKIGVNNIYLPPKRTHYACTYFNVKTMAEKITQLKPGRTYHAIAIEPNIDNVKRVHHMHMTYCTEPQKAAPLEGRILDCSVAVSDQCGNILFPWTPGIGPKVMPPETGIVWGSHDREYIKLQIHYDNVNQADGETDSSHHSVYFTTNLRKYDAGILTLGLVQNMFSIPPGHKNYDIKGSCTPACTGQAKGDITIFGYTPHGHMLMNKLVTEIKQADGSTVILKEDPFSIHKTKFIEPKPAIVVKPGFSAKTVCTYNTFHKTEKTPGGPGADNEMCYNYVMYYPKENGFAWCLDGEVPIELFMACVANEKIERVLVGEYLKLSNLLWLFLILVLV